MRKHGFLFTLTAMALAVMMCGCGGMDGVTLSTNSEGIAQTSGSASGLGESSVSAVNIDVGKKPSPEIPKKCKVYNATIKCIEPELMNELFFDGTGSETVDPDGETVNFEAENKHGYSGPNRFLFYTDNGTKFDDAVTYYLDNPNEAYMDNTSDLSFSSRNDALGNVMKFIDELGLDPEKAVIRNMYGIKKEGLDFYKDFLYKTAAEENDDKIKAQAEALSSIAGEDFYFINMTFSEYDIPVYSGKTYQYGADDHDTFTGTKFSLIYTKNGIEYFSAFYLYQKDDVISDSEIISFSEAQTLLKNKYDNMFVDNEIKFYDAELLYIPFPQNTLNEQYKKFIIRPYYVFYGTENVEIDGKNYNSEISVFFDAVTGKEL